MTLCALEVIFTFKLSFRRLTVGTFMYSLTSQQSALFTLEQYMFTFPHQLLEYQHKDQLPCHSSLFRLEHYMFFFSIFKTQIWSKRIVAARFEPGPSTSQANALPIVPNISPQTYTWSSKIVKIHSQFQFSIQNMTLMHASD